MKRKTLAIISGSGRMPLIAAGAAKQAGHRVIAIAIEEAGGKPPRTADVRIVRSLLNGAGIVRALSEHQCDGVLFAGKFDKGMHNLDLSKVDEVSGAMLARLPGRADMAIATVVLEELEARGFPPMSQLEAFSNNVAPQGLIAGPQMDPSRKGDVDLGLKVAGTVAAFDIGQTVVVRQGLVVAVEAAEHSDRCLRRAGRLVKGPMCVVKVARPDQDFRFDTPVVGSRTLRTMYGIGADLLAIEAGRCLIMDRDFKKLAEELRITVVGVKQRKRG